MHRCPSDTRLWPLYGAGFENLGRSGEMIEVPLPAFGPDELLVRHDAVGICFSDIKVIRAGQNHPRIYRDMREDPVVLGHEVILTVVGVGESLRDQYNIGDRFIVQADIYVDGVGYAYGYEIQGGFSQYNRIDQRVLNGDGGNYLLPVQQSTGYAEAALNEPWACVEASYIVQYRTAWREGGAVWIVGDGKGVSLGRAENWRPAQIVVDTADADFTAAVRAWADEAGVTVLEDDGERQYDDIVVLGNDPGLIEQAFARLAKGGLFNVVTGEDIPRRVDLDIGRMHYDDLGVDRRDGRRPLLCIPAHSHPTQAGRRHMDSRRGRTDGSHAPPACARNRSPSAQSRRHEPAPAPHRSRAAQVRTDSRSQ